MDLKKTKRKLRRKKSIRKNIFGVEARPRLSVAKSLNGIYAQIINDTDGKTLASASSIDKEFKAEIKKDMSKVEVAGLVGELLGKRAKDAKIDKVVFDRGGNIYHGRVKALAEGARKSGLDF